MATARQIDGCDRNISEQILGTKGILYLDDRGGIRMVDYDGNELWKYDDQAMPVKNPYEQEHIHLVESIRLNKKLIKQRILHILH